MLVSSSTALAGLIIFKDYSPSGLSLPTIGSAFVIGLIANTYARIFKDIALGPLLSGILFLVPGSLGVRGSLEFSNQQTSLGVDFVYRMLMVGSGVTVGLMFASILIFPLSRSQRYYMAY